MRADTSSRLPSKHQLVFTFRASPAELEGTQRRSRLFWFPEDDPAASLPPTYSQSLILCTFPFQNSNMVQILSPKSCFFDRGEENVEREGGTFRAGKTICKSCVHGQTFMSLNWFMPLVRAGSHLPAPPCTPQPPTQSP